jgi:hypothetical protein
MRVTNTVACELTCGVFILGFRRSARASAFPSDGVEESGIGKPPDVERRIMQVATIRWDFPQGHADE